MWKKNIPKKTQCPRPPPLAYTCNLSAKLLVHGCGKPGIQDDLTSKGENEEENFWASRGHKNIEFFDKYSINRHYTEPLPQLFSSISLLFSLSSHIPPPHRVGGKILKDIGRTIALVGGTRGSWNVRIIFDMLKVLNYVVNSNCLR